METESQKIQLTLSPQAERYARSDAPREQRLMAARGAVPLPPIELATVLFALVHDPDPEVKSTADQSLAELPDNVCSAVLGGPAHPALLSHLAHKFRDSESHLVKIALNAAADDATIAFLASLPLREVVEIVSNNQERMLRCPEIVDALGSNPLTGRAVVERILSFLEGRRPVRAEDDEEELEAPAVSESVSDQEAIAALRAVLGDDLAGHAPELVEERAEEEKTTGDANLYKLINKMSVFQKIRLGRLGNREARGLLVRDRNKVVAIAALTSPKITVDEISGIAKSRNVSEEVLRTISRKRDWTRSYHVKLGLATNPKTPQGTALTFVNYLQDKDLRSIMRSKDVPTAVSTHARRILMKKGKI